MNGAPVPVGALLRRIPTAGRLRFGVRTARAAKAIDTWRMTSSDAEAIEEIAAIYGGTPQPWRDAPTPGQWEVVTEASEVRVVLPPDPLGGTPVYELWSGGGCLRRCDGVTCTTVASGPDGGEPADVDCLCAGQGVMQCEIKTRLSVILPDVKFAGVWRLDSGSWNVAHELPGMIELIQNMQSRGLTRGLLALEHRRKAAGGQTHRFIVPVLRVDGSMDELASGAMRVGALATVGPALDRGEAQDARSEAEAPPAPATAEVVEAELVEDSDAVEDPAAEIDWRAEATQAGLTQAALLRTARAIAQSEGLPMPRRIDDLADPRLAVKVRRYLDAVA